MNPLNEEQASIVHKLISISTSRDLLWISGYLQGISGRLLYSSIMPQNMEWKEVSLHDKKRITILYGTDTGNSKKIALKLGLVIKNNGIVAIVNSVEHNEVSSLENEQYFFEIVSTQGEGEPPISAQPFFEAMFATESNLSHVHFGTLALGDLELVAANDIHQGIQIKKDLEFSGKLLNVADKPSLFDFYLGAVVKKGQLKIAISTNGKSPTIAKRLKENFNELLPANLNVILNNMFTLRKGLGGNFEEKINRLNDIVKNLALNSEKPAKSYYFKYKLLIIWGLLSVLVGILIGFFLHFVNTNAESSVFFSRNLRLETLFFISKIDPIVYWMFLTGFCAQMVNGVLGMGYGVISTLILLFLGIQLPAISSSVHTAELFSSAAGGISHYRLGNFNKKMFFTLLLPGILGGIVGALVLSHFGNHFAYIIKPLWGFYTLFLGIRILKNAFKRKFKTKKVKFIGWLAIWGGFLDSFGGGGWGPLVTGTLIASGKNPTSVIGTASIVKFFVTLVSAITFISLLGLSNIPIIIGLMMGGLVASPIGPRLSGKLPIKSIFIAVGWVVIISSLRILISTFNIL